MRSIWGIGVMLSLPLAVPLPLETGTNPVVSAIEVSAEAPGLPMSVSKAVTVLLSKGTCESKCVSCWLSSYYQYTSGGDVSPGTPDPTCTYAYCSFCGGSDHDDFTSALDVVAQAAQGDGDALGTLIREVPRLAYNSNRGSVQVLNCSSTAVVANIPVAASLRAIAESAALASGHVAAQQ